MENKRAFTSFMAHDDKRGSSLRNFSQKKIAKLRLFKTKSVPHVEQSLLNALGRDNFKSRSTRCSPLPPDTTSKSSSESLADNMEAKEVSNPQEAANVNGSTQHGSIRDATPRGSSSSASSGQGIGGNFSIPPRKDDSNTSASSIPFTITPSPSQTLCVDVTPRSLSLASISSEGSAESHIVEQADIVALSAYIKAFKEALGKLRRVFSPDRDKSETLKVAAHERLGEVLRILQAILVKYSPIQHGELLSAASNLISNVNGFDYDNEEADHAEFLEAIDHLALAFSSRVSDYLMGDIDTGVGANCPSVGSSRTKSCDNILPSDAESIGTSGERLLGSDISSCVQSESSSVGSPTIKTPETPTNDELDDILYRHERGVELALHRAKVWSKYAKDVITYIDKRCQLGIDFARNQTKLVNAFRPMLKEESFLPFQSIYCTALDHDLEIASSLTTTSNLLQTSKFLEPLSSQRTEHERMRKAIKESWNKQLKRLSEALSSLKRAKVAYIQKNQDLLKIQESIFKAPAVEQQEKLEKKKDDIILKIKDATIAYNSCVIEANEQHTHLLSAKKTVLRSVRELMIQADQIMKNVTSCYFLMQQTFLAHQPLQFQTLHESSRLLEPGTQYREFIKRLGAPTTGELPTNPFEFQPFTSVVSTSAGDDLQSRVSAQTGSDTDSLGSSRSAKSDASPTSSPVIQSRKIMRHHLSSGDELEVETEQDGTFTRRQVMSKAADTHAFRKLKTPSRCRECDSYVYFHGFECAECGLGCHKKCLESLAIQCGHKRLPRKLTTFGVDLQQHLQETGAQIPHLVCKCLSEIDSRGITVKGIYRVSGLKSRVEKLCQAFENGAQLVDLTDQHPNVIANVLKLYLRQLPEPLLTFRLYTEFIRVSMEYSTNVKEDSSASVGPLSELIKRLPPHHLWSLRALMLHLSRVAMQSDINNMPPSNLGIVFGPTLLRTPEGSASLNSLVDTVHQTRAIELLVMNAAEIFQFIDNWLPKNLKIQHPDNYAIDSLSQSTSSSTQSVPGLAASISGSSSSSSSTSSTSSGGGSTRILKQSSSMRISSRQSSVSSSKSATNIPSHSASVRKSKSKRKAGDEGGDAEWDWNSDEPFGALPNQSAPKSSVPPSIQTGNTSSPIVKTSLKNYVGLETGELEETTKETLEVPNHPKLRKSLSDNPPSSVTSESSKISAPRAGISNDRPVLRVEDSPLTSVSSGQKISCERKLCQSSSLIQPPQRKLNRPNSSSLRMTPMAHDSKSAVNTQTQEILKLQVHHHTPQLQHPRIQDIPTRMSTSDFSDKFTSQPATSKTALSTVAPKSLPEIIHYTKNESVNQLNIEKNIAGNTMKTDKTKEEITQVTAPLIGGIRKLQKSMSKEVLIGSGTVSTKKPDNVTKVEHTVECPTSTNVKVNVAVSSQPLKLSRAESLQTESVKHISQKITSVRSLDTPDKRDATASVNMNIVEAAMTKTIPYQKEGLVSPLDTNTETYSTGLQKTPKDASVENSMHSDSSSVDLCTESSISSIDATESSLGSIGHSDQTSG